MPIESLPPHLYGVLMNFSATDTQSVTLLLFRTICFLGTKAVFFSKLLGRQISA